ncbi:MAG TPA: hypothetical protein H9829_02480 [Candidatus Tetragenococcus pullicola]|nr:hypothetical protein [Candidatus Tetragenococcus pullicola]
MKKRQVSNLIINIVYGVYIFFVPFIVHFLLQPPSNVSVASPASGISSSVGSYRIAIFMALWLSFIVGGYFVQKGLSDFFASKNK